MARVLITGGTGGLGRALLPHVIEQGHTVRIMSRSARKPGYDAAIEWAQAEIETGAGLAEAVKDVDVIVHLASSALNPQPVDVAGTAKLLKQAEAAGIGHFIYMSIVGIDRVPFAYYKAKLEAERLIERSAVPWTILRATQFHSLMERLFLLPVVKMPLIGFVPEGFKFQLIDESEVAVRLAEIVQGSPAGHVADIGGPEVLTLGEIARAWLKATGKRRLLVNLPLRGEVAAGFRHGYNTAPQSHYGKITWNEWLRQTYGAPKSKRVDSSRQAAKGGAQ